MSFDQRNKIMGNRLRVLTVVLAISVLGFARSLPPETILELADGRIYSGEQAVELGLIDQLGNFTDAITIAAEMGGLDTEDPLLIYPKSERKFSLLNLLTNVEQSLVDNFVPLYPILSFEWTGLK